MNLKDMMYISLFTAVVGCLAFFPPIAIPFIPVPITAQTLGIMLAGGILGAKRGGLSLVLFVLLVAIGAPLLSGGRGGLGVLFGPSGGYILSWPVAAFIIGYLTEKTLPSLPYWKMLFINIVGGIIVIYLIGTTYLSIVSDLPWFPTLLSNAAFLPGDLTKVIIASYVTIKLHKSYPVIEKMRQAV